MKKESGIMKYRYILIVILSSLFLVACEPKVEVQLVPGDDQINILEAYTPGPCEITYNGDTSELPIVNNNVDNTTPGTYSVEYEIVIKEETYVCTRKVFVVDEEAPVITLNPGLDTISIDGEWIDASVVVTDNYSEPENIEIRVVGEVLNEPGVYEITYQAIDEAGNSSFTKRIVTVIK